MISRRLNVGASSFESHLSNVKIGKGFGVESTERILNWVGWISVLPGFEKIERYHDE